MFFAMTRKLILSAVFAAISVLASAQYKISSVDSQHFSGYELKYVLEGENSTFVYGTFTTPKPYNMCFDRTLAVYRYRPSCRLQGGLEAGCTKPCRGRTYIIYCVKRKVLDSPVWRGSPEIPGFFR